MRERGGEKRKWKKEVEKKCDRSEWPFNYSQQIKLNFNKTRHSSRIHSGFWPQISFSSSCSRGKSWAFPPPICKNRVWWFFPFSWHWPWVANLLCTHWSGSIWWIGPSGAACTGLVCCRKTCSPLQTTGSHLASGSSPHLMTFLPRPAWQHVIGGEGNKINT